MTKPKDPIFASQWHFRQIGDIQTIWREYSGKGVTVAVYDTGIDYKHRDLKANYLPSLHLRYEGQILDPYPAVRTGRYAETHATAVAGIIGAALNGMDTVGVAWGVRLTGVNILNDPRLNDTAAWEAALAHASNFDVVNNSWGYDHAYMDDRNPVTEDLPQQELNFYALAAQNGRDGLGTLMVQAAGNSASNANADPLNGTRFAVSVAATDRQGDVTSYSNFGSSILIAAPAAAVTLDLSGTDGENRKGGAAGNIMKDFGGTSAATPVVSGTIALMLDAAADLGWRDVREILATSARMTGSVTGGSDAYEVSLPRFQQLLEDDGDATGLSGDTWNDGGRFYTGDYGFGMVDVFGAVRLAEIWHLLHPTPQTSANEQSATVTASPNLALNGIADSISSAALTVVDSLEIENIDVTLTFTFTVDDVMAETWMISLISPTGSVFRLTYPSWKLGLDDWNGDGYSDGIGDGLAYHAADGLTWTFGVTQALGQNSAGSWTIEFQNMTLGDNDSGLFSDVSLTFYGDAADNDDIHYITADYLTAAGAEAALADNNPESVRDGIITDTSGGEDWLVLATLADAANVSLTAGGAVTVGGATWATLGAMTVIENLITGDGADVLAGNLADNSLFGMRGNDTLSGGGGEDYLDGGAGRDLLTGGGDGDSFVFERGYGRDVVTDFTDDLDSLVLDDALWRGAALTADSVISRFGRVTDAGFMLNFGKGATLLLAGVTDGTTLADDIVII